MGRTLRTNPPTTQQRESGRKPSTHVLWSRPIQSSLNLAPIPAAPRNVLDVHTLTSMNNLALVFWHQGRLEETEQLVVDVTEARARVLGLEHPDTLTSMTNLAYTWKSQGRDEDEADLMRQAE